MSEKLNHSINVTPLADVMLVLLIIFMVVTPYLFQGVPVNVPQAAHPTDHASGEDTLVLSMTGDRSLYLNTQSITEAALGPSLIAALERRSDTTLYVKGDASLAYREVLALTDTCRRAGFSQIALITKDRAEPAPN